MPFELPTTWSGDALAELIQLEYTGPEAIQIDAVAPLSDTEPGSLTFYSGAPENSADVLSGITQDTIICLTQEARNNLERDDLGFLITESPRFSFLRIVDAIMRNAAPAFPGVSPLASVDETAVIGENVSIAPFVTVSAGARIEADCAIGAGTFIGPRVHLKRRVLVGPNTTIGVEGQANEKDNSGKHVFLHHFGSVVVGEGTRIGSNTVLVSGSLQDMHIGSGCTIGHRVSVGHNCIVGNDCFVSANVTLAGSVTVGNGAWIGPGATVLNKTKIGNEAIVGIGSVVVKNVEDQKFVVGNPARELRQTDPTRYNRRNP